MAYWPAGWVDAVRGLGVLPSLDRTVSTNSPVPATKMKRKGQKLSLSRRPVAGGGGRLDGVSVGLVFVSVSSPNDRPEVNSLLCAGSMAECRGRDGRYSERTIIERMMAVTRFV